MPSQLLVDLHPKSNLENGTRKEPVQVITDMDSQAYNRLIKQSLKPGRPVQVRGVPKKAKHLSLRPENDWLGNRLRIDAALFGRRPAGFGNTGRI